MQKIQNSKFKIPNSKQGQSLLEIVIAVALAGVLLGGAVALIVAFTGSDKRSRELQTALDLANDIIEDVRNLTSGNWPYVYALDHKLSGGLVANWKFNEAPGATTAVDLAGTANGTLLNGANFVTGGQLNNALTLDGVNDYVELGNPAILKFTSSMTISAWIKLSSIPAGARQILDNSGYNGNKSWALFACGDCSGTSWLFGVSADGTNGANRVSTSALSTDWTHITAVYNAFARTIDMYINGVLDDGALQGTVPSSQFDGSFGPDIGNRPSELGQTNYFPGLIDELRVYDRPLSVYEAQALYLGYETPQSYYVSSSILSIPSVYAVPGEETIVVNGITYTRWFHVKNVYRNASGDIVDGNQAGAVEDPSTQQFIIRIIWGGSQTGLYFSQYLTRSRNEIFQQSDWSGDLGQDYFSNDIVNNKFISSLNINATNTQGEIKVNNVAPSYGELISSIFDTQSSSTLNSILWQGDSGVSGSIKFQIAASNNSGGPWNYIGCTSPIDPSTCIASNWFSPANNDPLTIPSIRFNNYRYFRYKIRIEFLAGGVTPVVEDVIINYSP